MTTDAAPTVPAVVTLFESYGAGAEPIGRRVAELLAVPFHAQAFSSSAIERAQADPARAEPTLGKVLAAVSGSTVFALGYGTNPGPDVHLAQQDLHELVESNTRTVQQEATEGGVIVGRNGALILGDRPNALHVRLDAPLEDRLTRATEALGISRERAAEQQQREDALRAEMSLTFYGWDPREVDRYDLVVNTGRHDVEACAALIVAAFRAVATASGAD
jgi:cytidylate kinase